MDASVWQDWMQEALVLGLTLALPVLVVAAVVGLLVSLVQSVFNVQDQGVASAARVLAAAAAAIALLPWALARLAEFAAAALSVSCGGASTG